MNIIFEGKVCVEKFNSKIIMAHMILTCFVLKTIESKLISFNGHKLNVSIHQYYALCLTELSRSPLFEKFALQLCVGRSGKSWVQIAAVTCLKVNKM